MVITRACQARDGGSIPLIRSTQKLLLNFPVIRRDKNSVAIFVREEGLEPSRANAPMALNHRCLPVPSLAQIYGIETHFFILFLFLSKQGVPFL
jgi:hypothetical protein